MANIGTSELLLILLMAAIVIGTQNIRPLLKMVFRGIRAIRNLSDELKSEIDVSEEFEGIRQEIADLSDEGEIPEYVQMDGYVLHYYYNENGDFVEEHIHGEDLSFLFE